MTPNNTKEASENKLSKDKQTKSRKQIKINNQRDWEGIINNLPFEGAAKMLVKNTLFESHESDKLVLTLNEEFNNLFTKNIQNSIEKTLLNEFNEISLEIECISKWNVTQIRLSIKLERHLK